MPKPGLCPGKHGDWLPPQHPRPGWPQPQGHDSGRPRVLAAWARPNPLRPAPCRSPRELLPVPAAARRLALLPQPLRQLGGHPPAGHFPAGHQRAAHEPAHRHVQVAALLPGSVHLGGPWFWSPWPRPAQPLQPAGGSRLSALRRGLDKGCHPRAGAPLWRSGHRGGGAGRAGVCGRVPGSARLQQRGGGGPWGQGGD